MKKYGRVRKSLTAALLAAAFALGVVTQPAEALTSDDVSGIDYYYGTGEASKTIDVLSVTGSEGDTVFVEMTEDGKVIASHLPFTLGADTGVAEGEGYVGAVSVTIDGFDPAKTYAIRVYEDREQSGDLLYEGTITPVYAQLNDGEPQLLAMRTMGDDDANRAFNAPATYTLGNATYQLVSNEPVSEEGQPLTYAYKLAAEAESIDGSITYVDDAGNVLMTTPIEGIKEGESRTVAIPPIITVGEGTNASYWRTVCFGGAVKASYPGTSDFTILCKSLGDAVGNKNGFHKATINYVDSDGKVLFSDSVTVTGTYRYTPPSQFTKKTGVLYDVYGLAEGQGSITLSPTTEGVENGEKVYNIVYNTPGDGEPMPWTIVLENGSADPKSAARKISTEVKQVEPGTTATYTVKPEIEIDGQTYVPVTTTQPEYSYEYGSGVNPILTIYYVPEGWEPKDPYDITVRYVNIANGEVLEEHTLTSRYQDRDFLEIASPEGFTQGGVEYVRLAGQDESLWHDYFSSTRDYTIYYRDINDDLSANIVITRTRVVYDNAGATTTTTEGGATVTEGGTTTGTTTTESGTTTTEGGAATGTTDATGTTAADGTAAAGDAAAAGGAAGADGATADLTIPEGDGLTVIEGTDTDTATVVDGTGRDLNTMRIEDDETPLASLTDEDNAANATGAASAINKNGVLIVGIVAAIAAACAIVFFVFFKRRKKQDETEAEDKA